MTEQTLNDSSFADKNGLARNIAKLKASWRDWKLGIRPHWNRFLDAKIGSKLHTLMNVITESFRGWPYLWAHILGISGLLVLITIIVIVVF